MESNNGDDDRTRAYVFELVAQALGEVIQRLAARQLADAQALDLIVEVLADVARESFDIPLPETIPMEHENKIVRAVADELGDFLYSLIQTIRKAKGLPPLRIGDE